jgi:TPR repeat/Tetratricopeptide repeat
VGHHNPNDASIYYRKGNALCDLRQCGEALAAYEQALSLDPNNAHIYTSKGDILCDLERYGEALLAYEQAIRVDPNYAFAYVSKGLALNTLKRYEKAVRAFDQAIRLDPHGATACYNRGLALKQQRQQLRDLRRLIFWWTFFSGVLAGTLASLLLHFFQHLLGFFLFLLIVFSAGFLTGKVTSRKWASILTGLFAAVSSAAILSTPSILARIAPFTAPLLAFLGAWFATRGRSIRFRHRQT